MVSEEYLEYLKSPEWQRLRSQRLKIDEYKCQKCGRPFDLDVHHIRYPIALGEEDVYNDLITLCRHCHNDIEGKKKAYREEKETREAQRRQELNAEWQARIAENERTRKRFDEARKSFEKTLKKVISENAARDLSNVGKGKFDFCNINVIKSEFGAIFESYEDWFGYVGKIQGYFRNRRYEVILDMIEKGYPPDQILARTGFSFNMVTKVCKNPSTAKACLKNEKMEELRNE